MHWLIDGYNVIRRDPDLRSRETESLEAGRTALLALVARVARDLPDTFTIVFDGARRSAAGPGGGRVQTVFSQPPATADDELRRRAAALREGAVVVSSDRAVQDGARRAGAIALGADAFLDAAMNPVGSEEEEQDGPDEDESPRRGAARRPSRAARAADRALRRLRNR